MGVFHFGQSEGYYDEPLIKENLKQSVETKIVDVNRNVESKGEPFTFNAELINVSLDAYTGSPSAHGIDGFVNADSSGGSVYFDSKRFELGFPDLFYSSWKMKRAEGVVSWKIEMYMIKKKFATQYAMAQ